MAHGALERDIFQILGDFSDMYTLNSLGGFRSILKVNMKIESLDLHDFVPRSPPLGAFWGWLMVSGG